MAFLRLRGLELTQVLDRARSADSPATLLRALARADVVLPHRGSGPVAPPVLDLPQGPTALVYSSYARLHDAAGGDERSWQLVSFAALAARWPDGLWLLLDHRATLSPDDVATVADVAAGLTTEAGVSVGACDRWVLWPGAALPDAVDLAVVTAADEVVEVRVVDLTGDTIRGLDVLMDDDAVVLWRREEPCGSTSLPRHPSPGAPS